MCVQSCTPEYTGVDGISCVSSCESSYLQDYKCVATCDSEYSLLNDICIRSDCPLYYYEDLKGNKHCFTQGCGQYFTVENSYKCLDMCPDDTQLKGGVCVGAPPRNNTTLISASVILAALVVVLVLICVVRVCKKKSKQKKSGPRGVVKVD